MKRGDRVLLHTYGGEKIWRRVTGLAPRRVLVCAEEDFGTNEERSIGFRLEDVIEFEAA